MTEAAFDVRTCPIEGDVVTCPNCMAKAWLWQVPKGQKVTLFCTGGEYERGRHVFQVEGAMVTEGSALLAVMRLGYALHDLRAAIAEEFGAIFRRWMPDD